MISGLIPGSGSKVVVAVVVAQEVERVSSNQMITGSISSSGSRNSGSGYGSALVESDDRWFDCRQSQ